MKIHDTIRPTLLAGGLAFTGALFLLAAASLGILYYDILLSPVQRSFSLGSGPFVFVLTASLLGLSGLLALVGGLMAFGRSTLGLRALQHGAQAAFFGFLVALIFITVFASLAGDIKLPLGDEEGNGYAWFKFSLACYGLLLVPILWMIVLYLQAYSAASIRLWTDQDCESAWGDRVIDNVRTHGDDSHLRKSWYASFSLHVTILFILPWLWFLSQNGCVRPYRVPKGSGSDAAESAPPKIIVKQQKKKKEKRKTYVVNANSAISFNIPKVEDMIESDMQEIEKQSQDTYDSKNMGKMFGKGKVGKMGAGGGTEGGWPSGFADGELRFIRLNHGGAGWDDGMVGKGGSDENFLAWFKKNNAVPFHVAKQGEANTISQLALYPKGEAPPFVFMTGDRGIPVSDNDVKILREFLQGGSMLFADASSREFDKNFRALMSRVFGKPMVVISNDDPILRSPYDFYPYGIDPLWKHGGTNALGIKIEGRWAVFYHPGDVHDAWKTGHEGIEKRKWENALMVGYNIIFHSVNNYMAATEKYRKR